MRARVTTRGPGITRGPSSSYKIQPYKIQPYDIQPYRIQLSRFSRTGTDCPTGTRTRSPIRSRTRR